MKTFLLKSKAIMNSTVKGDGRKHYKSVGRYYGFGWISKYSCINGCSYGRVSRKKKTTQTELSELEKCFNNEFSFMAKTLNDIIPGIVNKGQYISREIVKLSQDFHAIRPFRQGMITGMLCNNSQTGDLHLRRIAHTLS